MVTRVLPEISEDSFPELKAIMGQHLPADYSGWLEERQDWETDSTDIRNVRVDPAGFRQFVKIEGCLPDIKALINFATRSLEESSNRAKGEKPGRG